MNAPAARSAHDQLGELWGFSRLLLGLPSFLRQPVTLEQARATIRQRLERREQRFLRVVERGIYRQPRSPYLALLRWAGCAYGDLERLVRQQGVEGALAALRATGVYVGFEEFKGRAPIVRGGRVLAVRAEDFDNPALGRAYHSQSGGSTGAGTGVAVSLEHLAAGIPHLVVGSAAHGVLGAPTVLWRGVYPDGSGPAALLHGARMGNVPRRWFSPITTTSARLPLKHRLATPALVLTARACGVPAPWPEPLPLDRADVVARYVAGLLRAHGRCVVRASVSVSMRTCRAARELGLDLTGATFLGGGEPPTPAKVRAITETGAGWIPNYYITEMGRVGLGCANPLDGNDLHLMNDLLALIAYPRQVPGTTVTVDSFHLTSLSNTGPKLLLNVEGDDYGVLERRGCGCALETLGFAVHVREVRSFSKLTGEGVTLVGSEMLRVLEEVLPARFGGSPLDYQLAEEEDERGFTRLSLVVSPRLGPLDEAAAVALVLEAIGQGSLAGELARSLWTQAGTLRVARREPTTTGRGKSLPLHFERRARGAAAASGVGASRPGER